MSPPRDPVHLLLCRPGFEEALGLEVSEKTGEPVRIPGAGGLLVRELIDDPFIFERQRVGNAQFLGAEKLKPIDDETYTAIMGPVIEYRQPWAMQAVAMDPSEGDTKRAEGIGKALMRICRKQHPDILDRLRPSALKLRKPHCLVLQLCLAPGGLWYAANRVEDLSDLYPGGIRRMNRHPDAPSRSYLKIEEAFQRLGTEPQAGETAVDLGASPGGWTWAFLHRGCRVTAVDNGSLEVAPDPATGATLEHLREDGLGYRPEQPVDWMVSDMLVPPGMALGLLKRWLSPEPLMRRFVCNIKIPQQQPYAALRGIERWLEQQEGVAWEMRQLFHDRREVTVFGEVTGRP